MGLPLPKPWLKCQHFSDAIKSGGWVDLVTFQHLELASFQYPQEALNIPVFELSDRAGVE